MKDIHHDEQTFDVTTVSMSEACTDYAAKIGKPVDQLTDAEKKHAFIDLALRRCGEAAETNNA